MKNTGLKTSILALTLSMLALSGCHSSSSSDNNDLSNVSLSFNSSVTNGQFPISPFQTTTITINTTDPTQTQLLMSAGNTIENLHISAPTLTPYISNASTLSCTSVTVGESCQLSIITDFPSDPGTTSFPFTISADNVTETLSGTLTIVAGSDSLASTRYGAYQAINLQSTIGTNVFSIEVPSTLMIASSNPDSAHTLSDMCTVSNNEVSLASGSSCNLWLTPKDNASGVGLESGTVSITDTSMADPTPTTYSASYGQVLYATSNTFGSGSMLAMYTGSEWQALGGMDNDNGTAFNDIIDTISTDRTGNVYAGGDFVNGGTTGPLGPFVAEYNGSSWSALFGSSQPDFATHIRALGTDSPFSSSPTGVLFAGNEFITDPTFIASYLSGSWDTSTSNNSFDGTILAIDMPSDSVVYAGGGFDDGTSGQYIVEKLTNNTWSSIGGTTGSTQTFFNGQINSLISDSNGTLYAGGGFTDSNGSFLAEYQNGTWSDLEGYGSGGENFFNAEIDALAVDSNNNIYAGGGFTDASGPNFVAKYTPGSGWSDIGASTGTDAIFNGAIYALAVDSANNVYAGGNFTLDGNLGQNIVAKFTTADGWQNIGGVDADNNPYMDNMIVAMAVGYYISLSPNCSENGLQICAAQK
jgi:hypothetical protein